MKNIGKVKLNAVHKVLALIFMLAIVGTLCLANTPINAHGAQSGENDQSSVGAQGELNLDLLRNFDRDQPDNGLVRDGKVHDTSDAGIAFNFSDPAHYGHFAKNVMILTDNADQIKSETDLENYVHDSTNRTGIELLNTLGDYGYEVVAIWNSHNSGLNNRSVVNRYDGYPQEVLDRFGYVSPEVNVSDTVASDKVSANKLNSENVLLGDPDGDCGGAYICFFHDDGGQTGFHSVASYQGRWDYVNEVRNQSGYDPAIVVTDYGQNIDIDVNTRHTFTPSASFVTVSIR